MRKKEDLIRENLELRSRVELAEKWMRREVATSITKIQKEKLTRSTRSQFLSAWANDGIDILTTQILTQFESVLGFAPKHTLERLIDAEIYWHTLQQYPHMDALPIVLAYQKILDAWIEEKLIAPWRFCHREVRSDLGNKKDSLGGAGLPPRYSQKQSNSSQGQELIGLERDIGNIITKKYTLSIGRLYQIISLVREGKEFSGNLGNMVSFWRNQNPDILDIFISDEFFVLFTELMERELFSRKRHESKVTYSDAKIIREVMIGKTSMKSFLEMIFSI